MKKIRFIDRILTWTGGLFFFAALTLMLAANYAFALEPPPPGEIQTLRTSGELNKRLDFVRQIGNHKVDPFILKRAINKTSRKMLEAQGKSPAEIERMAPLMAPPPRWQGMPSTGNVRILTLLIEFQDHTSTNARLFIHNLLFGIGNPLIPPYESLSKYYERASYSQLDLSNGNTLGWYQTGYDRSSVTQSYLGRESLIKEALNHYNNQGHDFSQYDNDGNGTVDYFIVIWAGPDTGWGNFWWGYQTTFSDSAYTLDGVQFGKYSWQWEARPVGTLFSPIVVIHETGHALGIPDFYDYDNSVGPDGGVGNLDMMDANNGDHNCFSKWMLEWITPTAISSGSQSVALSASGTSQDCVLVFPGITTGDLFSEYFLAQNRHRVGNDNTTAMPSDGMLIWHVDATLDAMGRDFLYDNSFTSHKLLKLMEADGLEEIETGNGIGDSGDYYKLGDTFGVCTTPSSKKYDGSDSGVEINNISAPGLQMTANFSVVPAAAADYAITSLSLDQNSIDPGDSVAVTYTVKNVGGNPTACINMGIFLSTDAIITAADTQLDNWGMPNCDLAACESDTQTRSVTIPGGTAEGSYYIGIFADVNNYQAEADETNNTDAKAITVGEEQGGWLSSFYSSVMSPEQLALLRKYRNSYLKNDDRGQLYTKMLYENSHEALKVLVKNPDLIAEARDLIRENMTAVDQVLDGDQPRLENVDKIIAYLNAYGQKSPEDLKKLSQMVKDDMVKRRDKNEPFLGFKLD